MKKILTAALLSMSLSLPANAADATTIAKVLYIDEWDTGYTKVQIDKPTACGGSWLWIARGSPDYNLYMARVMTALVADRAIRISERAPAFCEAPHLYNPRIGMN
jgi:hypothetical protein